MRFGGRRRPEIRLRRVHDRIATTPYSDFLKRDESAPTVPRPGELFYGWAGRERSIRTIPVSSSILAATPAVST